jgi:hypothetical protein
MTYSVLEEGEIAVGSVIRMNHFGNHAIAD